LCHIKISTPFKAETVKTHFFLNEAFEISGKCMDMIFILIFAMKVRVITSCGFKSVILMDLTASFDGFNSIL